MKHYHSKLSTSFNQNESLKEDISRIKQKLINSINFMTVHTFDEKHTNSSILNKMVAQNNFLRSKFLSVIEENKNLRSMLQLHQTNNSLVSFDTQIKEFELDSGKEQEQIKLSPSRQQEEFEISSSLMVKKTIKERNKRTRRKRTEEFHFSSMGESSSDEDKTDLTKLRRKSQLNMFSGYKMQIENLVKQNEEEDKKETQNDEPNEEEQEKTKKNESEKKNLNFGQIKAPMKRRRINSEDNNDLLGLSPPNNPKRRQRHVEKEDSSSSSSSFGLMKGSGYKMSMQNTSNEEEKKMDDNKGDDDYYGCFNKSTKKREKRIKSMITEEQKALDSNKFNLMPKIKYSISIIEEEKSKSSSSNSSYKSSDDFTIKYSSKRIYKMSSFSGTSKNWSSPTEKNPTSSSGSNKKLKSFKTKKYTEGEISPFYDVVEKTKSSKKRKRINSVTMILKKLDSD
jgi:hypothetical protein